MSQNERIRNYLRSGKAITSLEALHLFGCFRLAARIKELRDLGVNVVDDTIQIGTKYVKEYRIGGIK